MLYLFFKHNLEDKIIENERILIKYAILKSSAKKSKNYIFSGL